MFPLFVPNIFLSVQPEDFADQRAGWNDQPGSQKSQITTFRTTADKPTPRGTEAVRVYYRNFSLPKLRYILFFTERGELNKYMSLLSPEMC